MSILAFDVDPMIDSLKNTAAAYESLTRELSHAQAVDFDGDTGTVSINIVDVVNLAQKHLPGQQVEPFISAVTDIANGGMAVFGSPTEIAQKTALAVPWVAISDLMFELNGTPPAIRSALGIDQATSTNEAVSLLTQKFANVPNWMIAGPAADRLRGDPVTLPSDGWGGVDVKRGKENPPKPSGHKKPDPSWDGLDLPKADAAKAVAECFIKGRWGPAFGHWLGSLYGFEVCLDQTCAQKLATLLTGLGGPEALWGAIKQLLAEPGFMGGVAAVIAGTKVLAFTAGAALAIYGLVLGLNILAVNSSKGVCLRFNWPIIGGPGMLVIAFPGY